MDIILDKIKEIVYECGEKMLHADRSNLGIEQKGTISDIVTKYDKMIQDDLQRKLKEVLPTADFVGEENLSNNPSDDKVLNEGYTFIVDPIDGTNNFAHDFKFSAISVALLKDRKPFTAVCYNPYANEMFTAIADKGAFLNGNRIYVSTKSMKDGLLLYDNAPYYPELNYLANHDINLLSTKVTNTRNLGSAVLAICYIACGKAEAYFNLRLQPWDYAAAYLILTEAGGVAKSALNEPLQFKHYSSFIGANSIESYNYLLGSITSKFNLNRLNHSSAVAKKMMEIAKKYNLSDEEIKNCFVIGLNHDIGYEFAENELDHNKVGGEILKDTGFKFWQEIYYHGEPDCEYSSTYLDILNKADMQIDNFGNDVGYEKRLESIKRRYGADSVTYQKCSKLVEKLK